MDASQLKVILHDHERWVNSYGNEGKRAVLKGANLRNVDLSGANLRAADLRGADFSGANLKGVELLWAVIMSPKVREEFKRAANGSTLMGQDGPSISMGSSAAMFELQASRARESRDYALELERRATQIADLRDAIFLDTDLESANLSEADLRGANFTQANLKEADLSDALIGAIGILRKRYTNLSGADLSTVKNFTRDQLNEATINDKTLLPF